MKCFYHPGYYMPLPEGHPFPMEKFPGAYEILCEETPSLRFSFVEPASSEQLLRVHRADYLEAIRTDGLTGYDRRRLGLPHRTILLERSARETAGTIAAMWAALDDGVACNLAGGTHHAFADRGLGYCVLNDVVVAIAELRLTQPDLWVMVIDTDAHQGNGTHALLREQANTYTYSIHVGRNYPAVKEPGDCDVPLERYVSGETYLDALQSTLERSMHAVEPDLVFWVSGADPHADDRFGQMQLSTEQMRQRDAYVAHLCQRWEVPLVVTYGGGYNRQAGMTGRLHANTVQTVAGLYIA